jgi:hypothetical protein
MTEEEFLEVAKRPGNLVIALGGVVCYFHREIAPYHRYEIWTRLLTWDRKWLYIVSYFVEAGALQPDEFDLQPWRKSRKQPKVGEGETLEEKRRRIRGKIFATSLATYVVKKGRLTIPPEIVLQRSNLLPEKPPGASSAFFTPNNTSPVTPDSGISVDHSPTTESMTDSHAEAVTAGSVASVLAESLFPDSPVGDENWNWDIVEKERQRGLRYAKIFEDLSGLRDELDAGQHSALGIYNDLILGI